MPLRIRLRPGPEEVAGARPRVTSAPAAASRGRAPSRLFHSHDTSRPNDSASRTRAATSAVPVTAGGSTSAAATVSTIPCVAADDLAPVARRQLLTHPRQPQPGGEEHIARRPDREHPGAGVRATYTLRMRIRNASTSASKCAPSFPVVRVRRATHPSTPSSTSASAENDTSSVTGAGPPNESAINAATPTVSVARARVTQSAGPNRAR